MAFVEKALLFTACILGFCAFVQRKHLISIAKMHAGKNPVTWVFCAPIIAILSLFALFMIFSPLFGDDVGQRGQYGDSFGIVTSLFTGLGFAGLTITLMIQQMQIAKQEQESLNTKNQLATERYELTLHQLLELYKKSVDSVVIKSDGAKICGLDALGLVNRKIFNSVQKHKVANVPGHIAKRFGRNEATEQDKRILDYIFQRNAELIQSTFQHQARLTKSFTLLIHHLEDRKPACFSASDMTYPRMMIHSQLTHVEVSYFFYLSLAFREEENLRRLLRTSGILEAFPNVCRYDAHRYMYMQLWNYDPKRGEIPSSAASKPTVKPGGWEVVDDEDDFDVVHRV